MSTFAVLLVAVVGCGSPAPTPSPPATRPVACIGLEPIRCERALAAVSEHMPDVAASHVLVYRQSCDGPCPGAERGLWRAGLVVEFADGSQPATAQIEVDGAQVVWQAYPSEYISVPPKSARVTGTTTEFTIGHCGFGSGIDVDGSFWNPVGLIDLNAAGLYNQADARFTLTSQGTATLVTSEGSVFQLVRHAGPKWLQLCD